eukprot:2866198-Rhodomonas_salina.1
MEGEKVNAASSLVPPYPISTPIFYLSNPHAPPHATLHAFHNRCRAGREGKGRGGAGGREGEGGAEGGTRQSERKGSGVRE